MRFGFVVVLCVVVCPAFARAGDAPKGKPAGIVCLLEDDASELLKLLTNAGDGMGQGEEEKKVVFSGTSSLRVTQYQRFSRKLPGWNHAIREKPKAGEYRYLRLAWKSDGNNSVMLQLHDTLDWNIRYTAGPNTFGWQTLFVSNKSPDKWTLVTLDLFKDFGERDLTGIAFTGLGFFDHVYLGRTIADLDRIDANGMGGKKLDLAADELKRLWEDLIAPDADVAYRAFWRLVAGRERSVAYLKGKLELPAVKGLEGKQILEWIRLLDSDSSRLREQASAQLKKNLEAATPFLQAELAKSPSAEVSWRIEKLLAARNVDDRQRLHRERAMRVIQIAAEQDRK